MIKLRDITFIFLLLLTTKLLAQASYRPGYIVDLTNETIYGEIDYRGDLFMSKVCRFKDADDAIKEYRPEQITAYRFTDDKHYVSKELDGNSVFLEFLIKGQVNIYYLRDDQGDHYYIDKDGAPLKEILYEKGVKYIDGRQVLFESSKHIGILSSYMSEAPQLNSRINSIGKPQHKNLISLARDYNEISNTEYEIFEKKYADVKAEESSATSSDKETTPSIKSDYVSTDSSLTSGIDLRSGTAAENAQYIQFITENDVIKYYPDRYAEYGFRNGQVYVARDVQIEGKTRRYFLERLANGNLKVFYLKLQDGRDIYYISQNDSEELQEIDLSKDKFHDSIRPYIVGCATAEKNLKYVMPKKSSLKRFFNYANNCSQYPYPRFHYGLNIGFGITSLKPIVSETSLRSRVFGAADYKPLVNLRVEAFADLPLQSSDLSLLFAVSLRKNQFSDSYDFNRRSYDLDLDFTSLNILPLIKKRFVGKDKTPFIQLGPAYSRVLSSTNTLFESQETDTGISTLLIDSEIIQNNMVGFSLGAGLIINSEKSYDWFGQVGYTYLTNTSSAGKNFNLSEFYFSWGIQF